MFTSLFDNVAFVVWRMLGYLIPKRSDYIILSTFPDFDDTFYALQEAVIPLNKSLIVLTRRLHNLPLERHNSHTTVVAAKSLSGIWYYHRAKTILFTHGLFSRWPPSKSQLVVNLWHGTPIKNIGLLDNKRAADIPKFDYVLAESESYRNVMANAFGVELDRVLVTPHPRIDMLYTRRIAAVRRSNPGKTIVAWLPTYRKSVTGDVREDGSPSKDILLGHFDVEHLDRVLRENNAVCLIKPHPMAAFTKEVFVGYSNISLLQNADLAAEALTVYEFLANVDILITDLSSVFFDFSLTGKPVLLFFPDYSEYESNRGFVRPIDQVLTGGFTQDFDKFVEQLDSKLKELRASTCKVSESLTSEARAKISIEFLERVERLQKPF